MYFMPKIQRKSNRAGSAGAKALTLAACFAVLLAAVIQAQIAAPQTRAPSILTYIKQTWIILTRSNKNLATAAVDPKFRPAPDGRWPVYVPQNADLHAIETALRSQLTPT